jgi:hypothetical protein
MSRALATAITLVAALGVAAAAVGLRSRAADGFDRVVEDEDRYYLPPSGWLRAFSLGYNEASADLLWIKSVVYFGGLYKRAERSDADRRARRRSALHTARYITAITDLDPRFVKAYVIGSRFVLYHKRRLTRETVEASIDILERGVEVFPGNGEIAFALGFFHYYELPQFLDERADRRAARERGARLLRRAGTLEGAPPYTSLLGVQTLRRAGLDELVVEHLRAMLITETDPTIRDSLEHQLRRELGKAAERDIVTSRALQARWKASMPYLSYDLFLLLAADDTDRVRETLDPLWSADRQLGLYDEP